MARLTKRQRKSTPKGTGWQGMNWIRKDKRLALYMRDGCACLYCGAGVETCKLTLDHVKPSSKGGSNSERNLVTCCAACNSSRCDKDLRSWLAETRPKADVDALMTAVASQTRRKLDRVAAREILAAREGFANAIIAAK